MKATVNPYQQYQSNQVDTADPKQLIVMLYDGAIRFLEIAASGIEDFKNYDTVNENILKSQDIITELMLSLNMDEGGEIAQNLFNLYSFMKKELLDANIKKEKKPIQVVLTLLKELKEAWEKVEVAKPNLAAAREQSSDYKPFAAQG